MNFSFTGVVIASVVATSLAVGITTKEVTKELKESETYLLGQTAEELIKECEDIWDGERECKIYAKSNASEELLKDLEPMTPFGLGQDNGATRNHRREEELKWRLHIPDSEVIDPPEEKERADWLTET